VVAQVPTHRVRRRELIAGIGVGAALWPLGAAAQEPPKHRIGMLVLGNGVGSAFGESLRALGYTDRNTTIEVRAAHGRMERFPNLAAELAALSPAVIYAMTPHAVEAARVAKPQTPIVMLNVADPVALGFVASLAHPGGNITGLANLAEETTAKRLELLKSAVPGLRRMAVLVDPNNPGNVHQWDAAQRAAPSLGVELEWVDAATSDAVEAAFAAIPQKQVEGLFVADDPIFYEIADRVARLALELRLPGIFQLRRCVDPGALMSFGVDLDDLDRRATTYVDKIQRGAKPADLPVEQPTTFNLIINLKTANAMGLVVPQSLLARADEVIE